MDERDGVALDAYSLVVTTVAERLLPSGVSLPRPTPSVTRRRVSR